MKKIVLFILVGLLTGSVFAQDPGAEQKNAGNAALKAKNYALAFTKYDEYLKITDYKDQVTIFNTAYCANKANKFAEAEKYFEMSIKNNYKTGSAYLGKAQAEEDLKKPEEMIATLEAGMKAVPGNQKLETMYVVYFQKEGVKYQKANDPVKAAENYEKILNVSSKQLKTKGFLSLGALYFNNGATILQKATPIANTDKEKYEAEKAKATDDFQKALANLEQAKTIDPENADVKELLGQVKAAIK